MDLKLELLQRDDFDHLYKFEVENRNFFEKTVPGRGEFYYNRQEFDKLNTELLLEIKIGTSYFYLIKNDRDEVVGRINVVDIDQQKSVGFLGYRIGEAFSGKGYASKALEHLMAMLEELRINTIHAKTTHDHIASQKVMEKNNFRRTIQKQEDGVEFIYYEWTNQKQ